MAETRKQVRVAKEQSARLVNLEEEVVKLGLERDKYRRFWLEVKVKAKTAKAALRRRSRLLNWSPLPMFLPYWIATNTKSFCDP